MNRRLQLDDSPGLKALDQLFEAASLEGFGEAFKLAFDVSFDGFFKGSDVLPKLFCFKSQPAAEGALVISLEPTDRLLDFLAAVRAGDLQREIT